MYSTIDSVLKKINKVIFLQLLNDENRLEEDIDLNNSNDLIVQRFNEIAEQSQAEIDPALRSAGITLPLTTIPRLIKDLSDNFIVFHIYERRNRENMPESIMIIRKEGLKTIENISRGTLDVGLTNEPKISKSQILTNKTSSDKIFNKDLMDKY